MNEPVTKRDIVEANVEKIFPNGPIGFIPEKVQLTEIATRPTFGVTQVDLDGAKMLAAADAFIPEFIRGGVGQAFAVLQLAKRWSKYDPQTNSWVSFDPLAIASQCYLVTSDGGTKKSVGYSSQLIGAIIDAFVNWGPNGRMRYRYEGEGQDRTCTASARIGSDPEPFEYTTPQLKSITPKKSPLYQSDPDRQLAYYARRAWARLYQPAVLMGVYDVEELEGTATQHKVKDINPIRDAGLHDRLLANREANGEPKEGYRDGVVEQGLGEAGAVAGEVSPPKARATKAKAGKRASTPPAPTPAPLPKTPAEYAAHVDFWLVSYDTEEAIQERWSAEKKLRNACGVAFEELDAIKTRKDQRIQEVRR